MTTPTLDQAYAAFQKAAWESAVEAEIAFPADAVNEAYTDAVAMESAAKKLLAAVEEYRATINRCEHTGKIASTPDELVNLIIDYDQDEVGHKASDVLRAAIAKPAFLKVAAEVVG